MKRILLPVVSLCVVVAAVLVVAQEKEPAEAPTGPQPVIIQRRAVELSSPDRYRVPLQLRPAREVVLTAPFAGVIKSVEAQPGSKAEAQFELAKIDSERLKLTRERAVAARTLAELQLRQATITGDKAGIALAEAQVKVADAEVRLTDYDEKQTALRAPYGGSVLDVFVQPGQRVQSGDPILSFGDLSQLRCRVPVERTTSKPGSEIPLNVEDQTVSGRVESVVALTTELQVLRELSVSVALADIVIDNPVRKLREGQAVFAPLIPKNPLTRVPLEVVRTASSGKRIVQILRGHVVRDIPVSLHGQDGKEEVFVSGPFTEHDELLLSVSANLADGTAVRPSSADRFASSDSGGTTSSGAPKQSPATKKKAGAAGF